MSEKIGSVPWVSFETLQNHMKEQFGVVRSHEPELGCPTHCERDIPHYISRGNPGESPWTCPQSLRPRTNTSENTGSLLANSETRLPWELWALCVFEVVASSSTLRQMLLLPNPTLRGLLARRSMIFSSSLCLYWEGDNLAYHAFQRWYNVTLGRLCPRSR